MYNNKINSILIALSLLAFGCKQSDPPVAVVPDIKGDFAFSGYQWKYKNATNPVGPGPNRFSGTTDFAWVDASGYLHLKIAKKNNVWTCSEIVGTKVVSYGTYIMTCVSDVSIFNENAVFGFFTWDNYSFQKQGNSEIDVWFSTPGPYAERTYKPVVATKYMKQPMTYMMRWTPDSVHWESYEGMTYPGTKKISEWSFDTKNISRKKIEGSNTSDPIVVPAPSDSTNVRFNFWLLNGVAPTNNKEHEVIISSFKYIPL